METSETVPQWERSEFYARLLWLFPVAYVLHIVEESNGFPDWVNHTLQGRFSLILFCAANAWFMLVLVALIWLSNRRRTPFAVALLFFFVSGQMFWDAVFHIYAENHFSVYSPGFFTATFLYLPLYGYLTYVALREGFLTTHGWLVGLAAGAGLLLLVIWAGLYHFTPIPWSLWG